MKKQLSILLLSTGILLSGCCMTCEEEDCYNRCTDDIQVKEKIVLETPAYFSFDSSDLSTEDKNNLTKIAERLKQNPQEKVFVNGYTDGTGPSSYNVKLSEERAKNAAHFLEEHGICADRIHTKGYGASEFAASNTTHKGRAQNRRIEVLFYE